MIGVRVEKLLVGLVSDFDFLTVWVKFDFAQFRFVALDFCRVSGSFDFKSVQVFFVVADFALIELTFDFDLIKNPQIFSGFGLVIVFFRQSHRVFVVSAQTFAVERGGSFNGAAATVFVAGAK